MFILLIFCYKCNKDKNVYTQYTYFDNTCYIYSII